jgi:hypothetical protein
VPAEYGPTKLIAVTGTNTRSRRFIINQLIVYKSIHYPTIMKIARIHERATVLNLLVSCRKCRDYWPSKKLAIAAKLRIYARAVVSVLTDGYGIWDMAEKVKAKIQSWNARCLSRITGRGFGAKTVGPSCDLPARLPSRRLRWAGHILRSEE